MYKVLYFRKSGVEERIVYSLDQAQRAADAMEDLLYIRAVQKAAPRRKVIKEQI